MGVRPLDLDHWLIVDDGLAADRAEKAVLLAERHADVVATLPGSEAPATEALRLVTDHLAAMGVDRPDDPGSSHPIEAAARLVQEDLVLLERDANDWRLTAACVCFPTRWRLSAKRGQSMADIHVPVPRYADDLGRKTERFFDRLRVDRPVWRTNWTIEADWGNRLEPGHTMVRDPDVTVRTVGERLCLRVEYQTLRRLPEHDSILFGIRILRRPLDSVLERPTDAARLMGALLAMPDDVSDYKAGSVFYRPEILEWLAQAGIEADTSASNDDASSS